MKIEELEDEANVREGENGQYMEWTIRVPIPNCSLYTKKANIVDAVRLLRHRVLLKCDDIICFAREDNDE